MPNSSGGQQDEEEEVEEVEEGAREQEFGQQGEDQVVKRRITVSRRPIVMGTTTMLVSGQLLPVKVYTMRVASERRMLRQVAFTEKVISTSLGELRLPQQHFVFDSNEKKVKAGKSSREG